MAHRREHHPGSISAYAGKSWLHGPHHSLRIASVHDDPGRDIEQIPDVTFDRTHAHNLATSGKGTSGTCHVVALYGR